MTWCLEVLCSGALLLAGEVRAESVRSVAAEMRYESVASDDTGRIWAAPREGLQEIFHFDADGLGHRLRFKVVPEQLRAMRLQRLADGWIACLWSDPAESRQHAVSIHRGDVARLWAIFDSPLKEPRLLACRDGSLLITERGSRVIRLIEDNKEARILTLPEELLVAPPKGGNEPAARLFAPVLALEESPQRVWLWSYALDADNLWRLAPLVLLRGDEFARKEIAGLPADARLSAVAAADSGHLWLPVVGAGLYKLDLATLRAEPAEMPEPRGFRHVENIFQARGDSWAVVSPRPTAWGGGDAGGAQIRGRISLSRSLYYDPTLLTGELWRCRSGRWERVHFGLDFSPRFGWLDRPVVELPHGIFVGSNSAGPWFFPNEPKAEPVWFWWQRHLPLRDARQLCANGPEGLFVLDSAGEPALVKAGPDRVVPRQDRANLVRSPFRMLQDQRGHIWSFGPQRTFREWNGFKETRQEGPQNFFGTVPVRDFVGDDRNRGWLFPDDGGKTAICDFTTGRWQIFASLAEALAAQLPAGVRLALPEYPFLEPVFSGQGHIAFLNLRTGLSFFDGKSWQTWRIAEIGGATAQVAGSPFFDRAQRLCLPLDGRVFELEAAGSWRQFEEGEAPERSTAPRTSEPARPPGWPPEPPRSIARDRFGTYWLTTAKNELVKALVGAASPAIYPDEGNPFRYGAQVHEVLVDPQGSAFLRTTSFATDYYEYVFLSRRYPPPETTIEKVEVTGDTAHFRFAAALQRAPDDDSKAPVRFGWRVDGGDWQLLQERTEVAARALAAGEHRVEVRAYGDDLVADPTPAEAKFVVNIDPGEQQRRIFDQLAGPDPDERERAARALTQLGAAVLPLLRAERAAATPDVRWWIDSVIQQIERARKQPAE